MSARGFVETAPRAFELALHFVSALRHGVFGMVLAHAWVAGHPVEDVPGQALASRAGRVLDDLVEGRFRALSSRTWVGTFGPSPGEAGGDGDVGTLAVVDAALAGTGWFAACRFVWSANDFHESPAGRHHERLVVAVDDSADEALRTYRLKPDDVVAHATLSAVRSAVLRELVVRPAFVIPNGEEEIGAGDRHI